MSVKAKKEPRGKLCKYCSVTDKELFYESKTNVCIKCNRSEYQQKKNSNKENTKNEELNSSEKNEPLTVNKLEKEKTPNINCTFEIKKMLNEMCIENKKMKMEINKLNEQINKLNHEITTLKNNIPIGNTIPLINNKSKRQKEEIEAELEQNYFDKHYFKLQTSIFDDNDDISFLDNDNQLIFKTYLNNIQELENELKNNNYTSNLDIEKINESAEELYNSE